MARAYSVKTAKNIIDRHNNNLIMLENVHGLEIKLKNTVRDISYKYIEEESLRSVKDISVDELSRSEKGLKIKTLKDNGYLTIGRVLSATISEIEALNGIGHDGSVLINKAADKYLKESRSNTRIKLSFDDRSEVSTNLVLIIAKYMELKGFSELAEALILNNRTTIKGLIFDASATVKKIGWVFTSKNNKRSAEEALKALEWYDESEYGVNVSKIRNAFDKIEAMTSDEAWDKFYSVPILFNNILLELCPDLIAKEDGGYGLPRDLMESLSAINLNLNGFNATLRAYQEVGAKYIISQKRVLLGDEMGLGKTIQAIAAMVHLNNNGMSRYLVVCPASVLSNWIREIEKFSNLKALKLHGSAKKKNMKEWIADGGVGVSTYESMKSFELDEGFKIDMMIVDEAHYIKNPKAARTGYTLFVGAHTERMLFMSGTALENKVDEMLVLLKDLNPKLAEEASKLAFMSGAAQFRDKIAPVYYRRKREDVLKELPDRIESESWLQLASDERRVYNESILSGSFMSARRVSFNVDDLVKSSKALRLKEIVEEALGNGRKVLVFSYFLETLNRLKDFLGDSALPIINGSVSPEKRQEIIDEFNTSPAGSVLLAQITSGGTGLNIQAASVVVLCEPQLKPSIESQAIARSHRMGQARTVLVHRLLCENTIDEKITELLREKTKEFEMFADKSSANEEIEINDTLIKDIMKTELEKIETK